MPENQSVDDFTVIAEGLERSFLVRAHEARIPLDIRGEDRGQLALDALRCHGRTPQSNALQPYYNYKYEDHERLWDTTRHIGPQIGGGNWPASTIVTTS